MNENQSKKTNSTTAGMLTIFSKGCVSECPTGIYSIKFYSNS